MRKKQFASMRKFNLRRCTAVAYYTPNKAEVTITDRMTSLSHHAYCKFILTVKYALYTRTEKYRAL